MDDPCPEVARGTLTSHESVPGTFSPFPSSALLPPNKPHNHPPQWSVVVRLPAYLLRR
jgi:hypothetical protein